MATQKKTAYHHGNLKDTLVLAAFSALDETPWENLSLRQLARQAGVTPTAAYSHFKDKIELLVAVKAEAFKRFFNYLNASVTTAAPADEKQHLVALALAYIAYNKEHTAVYSLLFSWAPTQDRITEDLMTSAAKCEMLIQSAIANYLTSIDQHYTDYSQAVASFFSWALAHGVSTLISGGNVQAATMCNNFPKEFMFTDQESSTRIFNDLLTILLAGMKYGLPNVTSEPEGGRI